MDKVLTYIELKAKMYEVLMAMHTKNMTDAMANNGFSLIFNVVSSRDWSENSLEYFFNKDQREKINENTIIIRISYFVDNDDYKEEFAAVDILDATDKEIISLANKMADEYASKAKEKLSKVASWKKH